MASRAYIGSVAQLTRPEAVVLALHSLGGADRALDTEEIAVAAARLVPGMFAWQRYPEQIDKELVRVALSDARLKKKWVVGSHSKEGWILTPTGLAFAERSAGRLEQQPESRSRGRDEQQQNRERIRLMSTAAFERFQAGRLGELTDEELNAFFRLNPYVREQAREKKITRIENQFGDDPELGELVGTLAERVRERAR
jgi:hypothetical protein